MSILLLIWGCGSPPPPPAPAPEPAPEPVAEPAAKPAPAGRIGGEPILHDVVVIGGISAEAISKTVTDNDARFAVCRGIAAEQDPDRSGKVALHFKVGKDGSVKSSSIRSTSLRHEPTEACLITAITDVRFPPLERGSVAIVTMPVEFP